MKNFTLVFFTLSLLIFLGSCDFDEDMCLEIGTPRMNVKFKDANGNLYKPDSLFVDVEFDNKKIKVANGIKRPDSILIPLRLDDSSYTNIFVRTKKKGDTAKIKIEYDQKTEYVSPGCGMRRLYENVLASVVDPNPVKAIESNQTEIKNESKAVLYFIF